MIPTKLVPAAILTGLLLALSVNTAFADRQLAIGAAGGFIAPPGAEARPVYTYPVGGRWEPTDRSTGFAFREPIYTTPRGYRYIYVRGYEIRRIWAASGTRHHKLRKTAHRAKIARHGRGFCVTDLGLGRYEYCR